MTHTHTHPFNSPFFGTTQVGRYLKQETVSGSGIRWAVCKSAPCSRQINMPTPHHSVFYMPDALPAAQPTASKHWMHMQISLNNIKCRSLSMPKYYSLHKSAPFEWGIWAPSIMWFLKTPRVHIPHTWLLKKNKQKETKRTGKNLRSSTHTHLTALCPGLPGWAGTRTVKPIWISLKQETVSGSGISWAICKSAPRSRQITTPAPHHSGFYRPDALPAAQPSASKHWRHNLRSSTNSNNKSLCRLCVGIPLATKITPLTAD